MQHNLVVFVTKYIYISPYIYACICLCICTCASAWKGTILNQANIVFISSKIPRLFSSAFISISSISSHLLVVLFMYCVFPDVHCLMLKGLAHIVLNVLVGHWVMFYVVDFFLLKSIILFSVYDLSKTDFIGCFLFPLSSVSLFSSFLLTSLSAFSFSSSALLLFSSSALLFFSSSALLFFSPSTASLTNFFSPSRSLFSASLLLSSLLLSASLSLVRSSSLFLSMSNQRSSLFLSSFALCSHTFLNCVRASTTLPIMHVISVRAFSVFSTTFSILPICRVPFCKVSTIPFIATKLISTVDLVGVSLFWLPDAVTIFFSSPLLSLPQCSYLSVYRLPPVLFATNLTAFPIFPLVADMSMFLSISIVRMSDVTLDRPSSRVAR